MEYLRYIYLYDNSLYNIPHNNIECIKLGYTHNIPERAGNYLTSLPQRGDFIRVFEIYLNLNGNDEENKIEADKKGKDIEQFLQSKLINYHIYYGGGTEFYNRNIINNIDEPLAELSLTYSIKELTSDEINKLTRPNRERNDKSKFKFRFKQEEIMNIFKKKIETLNQYYGVFIAPTGYGKTIMYLLFIALFLIKYNTENILIITKRKDLLKDISSSLSKTIKWLQTNNLFPINKEISIINVFKNIKNIQLKDDNKVNIFICNIDKLIGSKSNSSNTNEIKINGNLKLLMEQNIGFCIFDEIHWCGSEFAFHMMKYIKSKVKFIIGASATPLRTMYENQQNTLKIFNKTSSNNLNKYEVNDLEILAEISYKECWDNNVILPVEHHYLEVSGIIKEVKQSEGDKHKTYFSLSDEGYFDYLKEINQIWNKCHYGKGIFYFESRRSLLTFYGFLLKNYNKLKHLELINKCIKNIFMSFTISSSAENCDKCSANEKCINCFVAKKIDELKLNKSYIDNGIELFKKEQSNALLFVINRAIEGFNDPRVELAANIDYVIKRNIIQILQKIGRVQRICIDSICSLFNKPIIKKKVGHYISPVLNNEMTKTSLIKAIYDFISYVFNSKIYKKGDGTNQIGYNTKYIKLDERLNISQEDINEGLRKLDFEKGISFRKFIDLLKCNEIHNNSDYYQFKNANPNINLCDNPFSHYSKYVFYWELTYDISPYYNCEECIERIKELVIEYEENGIDIDDIEDITMELNKKDEKIPNITLYEFYNCNKEKFLIY